MNLTPSEIQAIATAVVEMLKPILGAQQSVELTSDQVAELLKVSKSTVERWTAGTAGCKIPSYLVGRCRRYNREAVLNAVRSQEQ